MAKAGKAISRRNALLVGGGAVAAVGVLAAAPLRERVVEAARSVAGAVTGPGTTSLAGGGYDAWLAQVGTSFAIGGGVTLRLAGVRAFANGGDRPAGMRNRAFVAFFDPAGRASMPGDLIYTASHASGPLQMFLTAAPDTRAPTRMQAVFG